MSSTNKHPLTKLLVGDLIRIPNGKDYINNNFNDWVFEINTVRTNRWIKLNIQACKPSLNPIFEKYSVETAMFMSLIARYRNYKSSGKESVYSDLILSSKYSKVLLQQRNAEFLIDNKCLNFKARIRRKNENNLVPILIYCEKLTEQFDNI